MSISSRLTLSFIQRTQCTGLVKKWNLLLILKFAAISRWQGQRYEYLLLKVETNGQDDFEDKADASPESYHTASGLCSKTIY